MKLIEGFEKAKTVLSRQSPDELYQVSPRLRERLQQMFGVSDPESAVKIIIDDVRQHGDRAILDYTRKIDGIELKSLEVSKAEINNAYQEVSPELVDALKLAAEHINAFHQAQKASLGTGFTYKKLRQIVRPLKRIGAYVPGGTASYPSTVLMTAVPARVAGVEEVVLTTPPRAGGVVPPLTLVAADIAAVDRVFAVGGAQAIAAMAYGTETIPKVNKICGPGNIFVTLAKKLVYGMVGIDGLQGPSEVVVVADESAKPEYCAADILAQAEHDSLASAVFITSSPRLARQVSLEVEKQLQDLPRRTIATEALENHGTIVVVASIDEAIELVNLYAPEHLCLIMKKAETYLDRIGNAGCIVTGQRATVVMGDYAAGPSHVLPTGGTAKFSSPLNVSDFLKFINVINIDSASLKELGTAVQTIAKAEGLEAHARTMHRRLVK